MSNSLSHRHHDVVVIGGGSAGIAAASAAASNGADTLLVDAGPMVGGELLSGIPIDGCLNTRGEWIVGGFLNSLLDDLKKMGGFVGAFFDWRTIWVVCVDPERMKLAVAHRLREDGAKLLLNSFVDEVVTDGDRVTGIVVLNKSGRTLITADIFLDCSGDGDVAAGAGADYQRGDGKGVFQPVSMVFRMAGVDTGRLLDFARDHPDNLALGENEWLNKSREECLRELIALGYPKVFLKADGPLMSKSIAEGELYPTALLAVIPVSADLRVVAINSTRVANVDATDTGALSATMPSLIDQVWNCQSFVQKRVPGFEEAAFAGIAPRIGIRETRRIVGEETLQGDDVLNAVKRDDGVAKGGHHVDVHGDGTDQLRRPVRDGGSYDIPLGCLLPKGIENMGVAGRCLSADRVAHGSARVMGTCIAMGQAVGTAAAMVCESNVPKPVLGDVPLPALRDRLVSQGAILDGTH
ncbi:FAD-dependent oxidoreductase [Psychromarinibacter sp. C21-152]|uniref:FAD-dependent oxidoreductase n=1 Tax=Psychromarinibacter sediminicola TaxID=3033385 RepID=A0AAE3T8G3_9RHOB|nr:FAD-dependent oxidoreductase [Psychromarinibacter sediminicola]MDF0601237.1 FAD-dependent oxidoreductase [Psychromarinibacter sediminicola]